MTQPLCLSSPSDLSRWNGDSALPARPMAEGNPAATAESRPKNLTQDHQISANKVSKKLSQKPASNTCDRLPSRMRDCLQSSNYSGNLTVQVNGDSLTLARISPDQCSFSSGLIPKCGGLIRARPRCRRIIGQRRFFRYWLVNAWVVGIRPPPSWSGWSQ